MGKKFKTPEDLPSLGFLKKLQAKKRAASKRKKTLKAKSLAKALARAEADTFAQSQVGALSLSRGNLALEGSGIDRSFKTAPARVSGDVQNVAGQLNAAFAGFFAGVEQTKTDMLALFVNLVGSTFAKVQDRTPVDTGHARSAWVLETVQQDPNVAWFRIHNGVLYVVFLEYGSSRQAPAGMLRVSLLEAEQALIRATSELRRAG